MNAPLKLDQAVDAKNNGQSIEIPLSGEPCSADDSRISILQIISDLQNHHRRRNFSHQERFGRSDPFYETMLADLADAFERAKQLLEEAQDSRVPVVVESSIKVSVSPQQHG